VVTDRAPGEAALVVDGRPLPRPTCPLCGGPNRCGPVAADDLDAPCWCTQATFPAALLARVPEAARGVACLCAACAGMSDPAVT
jgi:Cysteine-rich CWC